MRQCIIIGWFDPRFKAESIAEGFEREGWKVIRVASDKNIPEKSGKHDYHLMWEWGKELKKESRKAFLQELYMCDTYMRVFQISTIIKKYPESEFVILVQDGREWDSSNCTIPIYFLYNQIGEPVLPFGLGVKGLFYSFIGGKELIFSAHPYQFKHFYWTCFMPQATNEHFIPEHINSWEERTQIIGFMGSTEMNPHSKDPLIGKIYDNRKKIIDFLQENYLEDFIFQPFGSFIEYAGFMNDTKIAINIPGDAGCINQRQFEALAFGCLLLQYNYEELNQLGFYDGIDEYEAIHEIKKANCLTFDSPEDLEGVIKWIQEYPDLAEQIRLNGIRDFKTIGTLQGRAHDMLNQILMPTEREMEYLHFVDEEIQTEKEMIETGTSKNHKNQMIQITIKNPQTSKTMELEIERNAQRGC